MPRRTPTLALAAGAAAAALVAIGYATFEGPPAAAGANGALAAVTNPDGSPKEGYDPADQPQTSLRSAAGKAATLPPQAKVDGSVGVNPDAKGVNAGRKKQVASGPPAQKATPGDVLTRVSVTGGCRPEYGRHGECLPFVPPSHAGHPDHAMDHAWSCTELRTLFPDGIPLRQAGVDPLALDSDADGTACGRGDA